jgi:uncharacterized protein (TIGR00369 family)
VYSPFVESDALREFAEKAIPFNRMMGLSVVHARGGDVRLVVPFRPDFVGDPMRPALHGGVISMLADTAGGISVWSALDKREARVSTIDLRVDYLLPGKLEDLTCDARVVRMGGRVGVTEMRLFHPSDEDVTVATGKGVYAIATPRKHG